MKQPIELRKVRDFGQLVNDSFTFLKENFKALFIPLLVICGFFIVLGTIGTAFTYLKKSDMYSANYDDYSNKNIQYLISLLISTLILIITQACIHLVTICYISVYLQKGNVQPVFAEVWGYFRYYFFRVLWASIVVTLLFLLGFVLCFIPGIYLMPILYLIIPIIVIENSSFSYAFNKSFRIIKENWWVVFGVIFIMSLIVSMSSSFASLPLTLITTGSKFISLKSFKLPVIIFFSILHSILMLAYCLPSIAICLCYFNLDEQKDGSGLLDRIEKFGKRDDDNPALPIEEY